MMHITYFMERLEINGVFESRRLPIRNSLSINELQSRTCERFFMCKNLLRTGWGSQCTEVRPYFDELRPSAPSRRDGKQTE